MSEKELALTKRKFRARLVEADERAAVWNKCAEHYPPYGDYQARTERVIPVFVCETRGE